MLFRPRTGPPCGRTDAERFSGFSIIASNRRSPNARCCARRERIWPKPRRHS